MAEARQIRYKSQIKGKKIGLIENIELRVYNFLLIKERRTLINVIHLCITSLKCYILQ
jgi:hypothetical protein